MRSMTVWLARPKSGTDLTIFARTVAACMDLVSAFVGFERSVEKVITASVGHR